MTKQQIVANELADLGFETQIASIGVLVSLNRPIYQTEIETALEQAFEGITFEVRRISKQAFLVS